MDFMNLDFVYVSRKERKEVIKRRISLLLYEKYIILFNLSDLQQTLTLTIYNHSRTLCDRISQLPDR